MKYSKTESETLLVELLNKENNLRSQQTKISLLRRSLTELKDINVQERHPDGQAKLDKNRKPILTVKRPIDINLGTEITEERRDAIFTKIVQDSQNL